MEDEGTTVMGDDRARLVEDEVQTRRSGCCSCLRHKRLLCFLVALALIATGHVLAIYFLHFKDKWTCTDQGVQDGKCVADFRVLSLNTWGMPERLGSEDKAQRMKAISEELSKGDYDLYLFEELWMRPDYATIRAGVPKGYHMTDLWKFTNGKCDGRIGPDGCSGLAIVSKYPILETEFFLYNVCGNPSKIFIDGECLASKGVGRIRLGDIGNMTGVALDVYVTHTVAQPPAGHGYDNVYYRIKQVTQLVEEILKKSTADAVILGGDFNAGPEFTEGTPYQIIQDYMQNTIEDIYWQLKAWLRPEHATYANARNTFSAGVEDPVMFDYIFHRNQNRTKVHLFTNWFKMPFFTTALGSKNISFSDHEAVTSSFVIKKLSPQEDVSV